MLAHCFPMHVRRSDVISNPINIDHPDSHMYHVLYLGVLIRSSFGGVTYYMDIGTNIYTESQLTANTKILAFANEVPV
jgi:hypothetical protein